jgi:hypothetical protein
MAEDGIYHSQFVRNKQRRLDGPPRKVTGSAGKPDPEPHDLAR